MIVAVTQDCCRGNRVLLVSPLGGLAGGPAQVRRPHQTHQHHKVELVRNGNQLEIDDLQVGGGGGWNGTGVCRVGGASAHVHTPRV